uniref:treslin n=1 Tax=Euleptes europaea TaxID=460621 RepID=UPI002540591E|nr:treslin [Euleptes europaea]
MTCSHNVVFLLDTACSVQKAPLHLGTLKILNYLGCRFGLAKVRWGFKFFDSFSVHGRISRVGSFRELGSRSWEDFEEELEARFDNRYFTPNLPGPPPRATLAQNILKEALLDYQWDRPEIASPAKPVLRSQKSKLTGTSEKPLESSNPSEGFINAVFLFSPCPHSRRELLQFVSGSHASLSDELLTSQDLAEKFIPKGIQEMMAAEKITLHWVDTADDSTFLDSPDHVGYHLLADLMDILKGTILPSGIFIPRLNCHRKGTFPLESASPEPFLSWATILPLDSTLNCLFFSPSALQASFPQLEGMLFLKSDGKQKPQGCAVTLEPLTVSQRCFENPVSISLQCAVAGWDVTHTRSFHTESWIIRSSPLSQSAQETSLFQHLLRSILAQGLHLVADVSPSGSCSPRTGIFSPVSSTAAILSLLCAERTPEVGRCLLQTAEEGNLLKADDLSFPETVSSVLSQENDLKESYPASPETPLPEWAQQELSRTHRWSPVVIEGWYPFSNLCGASSPLMESLRLLQAAPATVEETPKPEMELTQSLSEFYQRRASEVSATSRRQDHKKRRGAPRTPVRQKMKTMPRSLQMLNAARLNVKAQKLQPDEELAVSEKASRPSLPRRSDDGGEEKGRIVRAKLDFKTEEEMVSYATTSYQKAVADGENLSSCARDIVAAMNIFQITNDVREKAAARTGAIRSSLLKNSKALRQQLGNVPDKQVKVRECQLQVYLRLEMSLQCPWVQDSTDEMEQLVEEATEVLRILCLAEDPAYLTRFLEDAVEMYMESIPKTLGSLYYSLGTQVPPKLAALLPADFFGDDSLSQESQAPSLPASAASDLAARSGSVNNEAEKLEELRTRSAKKRKSTLSRHRSVTEASLNLRQIEIPQVPKARTRKDSSRASLDLKPFPAAQKTPVQEVTKVRRNLFNEEMQSPARRSLKRIPRSQSVSALEGLRNKDSQSNEASRDHHKLLTKRVAETPLHKQISRRLLHRQIQGRCSDPGSEVGVVEESPEKSLTCGLRRSPRIKQLLLDRALSGSFPSSQATMKNVQQVPSAHLEGPGTPEDLTGRALPCPKKSIQSPKSLLFGALHEAPRSGGTESSSTRRKSFASDDPVAFQTPRKTPRRSSPRLLSLPGNILRRSPRIREKSQQTLLKSPVPKQSVAKNLGCLFSPPKRKSQPSPMSTEKEGESLALSALPKESFSSPRRAWRLRTPGKQETGEVLDEVFGSPTNSSHPASYFMATTLLPLSPRGRFPSPLLSPRRSLRTPQKPTSPSSAWKRQERPEEERQRDLKSLTPLKSDSALSDRFSRKSLGGPSDRSLSPTVAGIAESFSSHPSLSSFTSSPGTRLRSGYVISSCGTPERVGETRTPKKLQLKPQCVSGTTPTKSTESPSCVSEDPLHAHGRKGEPPRWDVSVGLSAETDSLCKPRIIESVVPRAEPSSGMVTPSKRGSERHLPPALLARDSVSILDSIVACEGIDLSDLANTRSQISLSNSSPGQQAPMALRDNILPAAKCSDPQPPFFQTPPRRTAKSSAPKLGSRTYTLRCTADRRQREATARLGSLETTPNLIAPWNTATLPSETGPPTYEVELEMQASGLPKLRIKRVGSGVPNEPPSQAETRKPKGEDGEFDTGDLCVSWCGRHPGKLEPVCISPSCCRSTHSTPGELGGGQTYICQSYTPSRCILSSTPPSDGCAGVSWTPSPKQKVKVTPEAIKDWPRRKRAVASCNKSERQAELAVEILATDEWGGRTAELPGGSKAPAGGEFGLEGIYRLQDQSPCSDTETGRDKRIHKGAFGLRSRKRVFEHLSPEEEASWETKRARPVRGDSVVSVHPTELFNGGQERALSIGENLDKEEAFDFTGLTPPGSSVKSSISASSLRALTLSPLLYQGRATSRRKRPPEDSSESGAAGEDLSPFKSAPSRRRSLSRTYSRKRLLS